MRAKILSAPVIVATAEVVATLNTSDCMVLGIQISNTGGNDLVALEIYAKTLPDAPEMGVLTVAADYTNPSFPCIRAWNSPMDLPAGEDVWLFLDTGAFDELVVKAKSAVGATTLDIFASGKNVVS